MLNATIKLFFCWGELFFVLVSLLFVIFSGLVSIGKIAALSFPAARTMANWVLVLSSAVLLCTGFGCLGSVRQTLRRGCCTGRKMLCGHQLLLLFVVLFSISQYEWLNKREQSLKLVIGDHTSYPEYDGFERRISKYFNSAYFDSLCSDDPSTAWLLNFVDKRCPDSQMMGQEFCALSETRKKNCDTSCAATQDFNEVTSRDLLNCCPSEELCKNGNEISCPYHRCRVQILEELDLWVRPSKVASQFVLVLSTLMLILSCLLICYNPRDEIEMELLKTGVMTTEDVEAIRRLKESATTVARGTINVEKLDTLKNNVQPKSKFGYSRKRMNRVSPTT